MSINWPTAPAEGTVYTFGGVTYTFTNGMWMVSPVGVGGGITDADKGDITVTGGGNVWTIDPAVVSNAKLANMAQSTFKMRAAGAGTGDPIDGTVAQARAALALEAEIGVIIDGGSSVIQVGTRIYVEVPFACTINRATLLSTLSGAIVVDIFKCTYAAFDVNNHPVASDKITGSTPPTLVANSNKSQDAALTGWTTAINAGDILAFNVNSVSLIVRVTCGLKVTRA